MLVEAHYHIQEWLAAPASPPMATFQEFRVSHQPATAPGVARWKLKRSEYALILDYSKVRENYNVTFGAGRNSRSGQRIHSEKTMFTSTAAMLAKHYFPRMDGADIAKRVKGHQDIYKKVLVFKNSSVGGMCEEKLQAGVTLEGKLDKMSPYLEILCNSWRKSWQQVHRFRRSWNHISPRRYSACSRRKPKQAGPGICKLADGTKLFIEITTNFCRLLSFQSCWNVL